jgi:hypothetical protein
MGFHLIFSKNSGEKPVEISECCGAHEVCKRNIILTSTSKIIYFDDEELDILSEKRVENFTEKEIEMLNEVLFSLQKNDILGWLHSLELRKISLPETIKGEALILLSE